VSHGQRNGSPRLYSHVSRSEPLLFLPSSSSAVLTRLSGPRSRPTACTSAVTIVFEIVWDWSSKSDETRSVSNESLENVCKCKRWGTPMI
jgi:hypothetical protein